MWTHFTEDATTLSQDGQYMWGDSLLFTPVLTEGATDVTGYFPRALWYSMTDGGFIDASESGQSATFDTPVSTTNVHVRGGSIVPMQSAGMTTKEVKESPFTLLVALDSAGGATGSLFLDDGVQNELTTTSYIEYMLAGGTLVSAVAAGSTYETTLGLASVEIRGIDKVYGTACSSMLTTQPQDGTPETILPTTSVMTVGDSYATLTLSFDGVLIASDYVIAWDCSELEDDDNSVFGNVYSEIAVAFVGISAFMALLFFGSRMIAASKDKSESEEALLYGQRSQI
jgi:hypothetical protein